MYVPILACLFMRRLATHSTIEAPELSMQFSIVCYVLVSLKACDGVLVAIEPATDL
jgi:hypothetical protein